MAGRAAAGPVVIDDLVEICHGAPFDEDVYIFDELDARRGVEPRPAPALPVRAHARAGGLQAATTDCRQVGPPRGDDVSVCRWIDAASIW